MDAITTLRDDHKRVEKLFKQFEKLAKNDGGTEEKAAVVREIIGELSRHAAIEEQVFYPSVRKEVAEAGDVVLEGLEEHHIVKWTLSELDGMTGDEERYDAKVTVLMESVRHHVEEEEGELFPQVREALGRKRLQEMGEAIEMARKTAPARPHPKAPDEPPANLVAGPAAAARDSLGDKVGGLLGRGGGRRQDKVGAK
jgi:hemerythrin superfamily protein